MRYPSYSRGSAVVLDAVLLQNSSPSAPAEELLSPINTTTGTRKITAVVEGESAQRTVTEGGRRRNQARGEDRGGKRREQRLPKEVTNRQDDRERAPRRKGRGPSTRVEPAVKETQLELEALRKELESAKELLRVRGEELAGVRTFLDTADKTSLADVRQTVEHRLTLRPPRSRRRDCGWEASWEAGWQACSRQRSTPRIHIAYSLHCKHVSLGISLAPVHSGIQMPHRRRAPCSLLKQISIQEHASVSRRWRALAFKCCKQDTESLDQSPLISSIAAVIADILFISGVDMDLHDIHATVLSRVETRIEVLLQTVETLRGMFYEGVVSCNLTLHLPTHDGRFDVRTMEDLASAAEDSKRSPSEMLCATELGLSSQNATADGDVHSAILLKAKVVSDTMVNSIFRNAMKASSARSHARGHGGRLGGRKSHR